MNTHSTHRLAGQGKFARITDLDIDAALHDMAAADGYDGTKLYHTDRLLRSDTAACEQEQPDDIDVTYEREPVAAGAVFGAGVFCICLVCGIVVVAIAWLAN